MWKQPDYGLTPYWAARVKKPFGKNPDVDAFNRVRGMAQATRWISPLHNSGHFAPLSPSCCLPVASLSLFWHFWPPVTPLSLARRLPVALPLLPCHSRVASLSLSCRPPVAFLPPPIASCRFLSPGYFLPGAFLLLSCRCPVLPSFCFPVAIFCCLPVALLSLACRLSVTSLPPPCRLPVASLLPNVVPCCSPVACLSLACRLPVAFLSRPFRLPVDSLSPDVLAYCSPVAFLWLACRFLVGCLSPTRRFPVAFLSIIAMSCFLLLPCGLSVAALLPPCRFPVALLSHLPCRLPVACLSLPVAFLPLSCRFPVVFLSPPCPLPVATLSPSCRSLPHFAVACPGDPSNLYWMCPPYHWFSDCVRKIRQEKLRAIVVGPKWTHGNYFGGVTSFWA